MHIYVHMRRNPKNTRNTDDSLGSGTKLLLPSWLLGFRQEGRETHNSYDADCSSGVSSQLSSPTNARAPCSKQLDSPRSKSQLTAFFSKYPRIPAHRFRAWRHSHPHSYFLSGVFIFCDCRIFLARAWISALNVCTLLTWLLICNQRKKDNIKKIPSAII